MEKYILMSFETSHHAIGMEIAMEEAGHESRLIPLPPEISAGCGLVLRFFPEEADIAVKIAEENNIEFTGLYEMLKQNNKRVIHKME